MYGEAAQFYDMLQGALGRDDDADAGLIVAESRRVAPHATSLLDAGCGTGVHLPRFCRDFDVVGLDLSGDMLKIASERAPGVRLVEGDFRTFDLGSTVDVAVSLFSGIGYLREFEDLCTGITNIARHLNPGGAVLVEGWVEPEFWTGSTVSASSISQPGLAVARTVRSSRDGLRCEIEMEYVAARADGLARISEQHVMRLSDPAEFEEAYSRAGLTFTRLPHMLHPGRSVYIGLKE